MLRAISDEIPDAEDPREKSEDRLKTNYKKKNFELKSVLKLRRFLEAKAC